MLITRPGTQGAPRTSHDSLNLSLLLSDSDVVICGQLTKKWLVRTDPQSPPSLGHITLPSHFIFNSFCTPVPTAQFVIHPSSFLPPENLKTYKQKNKQ